MALAGAHHVLTLLQVFTAGASFLVYRMRGLPRH